uniref:MADF domain-containing protein n=1 Tax=Anopheles gambiae TaxID=7165 RepID=A0A453YXL5_ANOGA
MGPTKISPEDQSFNITFVWEVKKHPCLFDSSNPDYKQQTLQERAWQAVSDAVGEGVDTCKKRWRNLRCCMTRYQKSVRDNPDQARRKPYYLYSHMQFVLPYLKAREETSTYEQDEPTWTKGESESMSKNEEEDEDEDEEEPHEIETITVPEEDHSEQIKDSILQSIKIMPIGQEASTITDQQQQQHHQEVLHTDSTSAANTTTTYEIITAPPVKQPRLSQTSVGAVSPIETGSTLQSVANDSKRDLVAQRQFFTITNTPMQPASIPMPCYTSNPITSQTLHHQQPPAHQTLAAQPQLQTQVPPHFTFIPSTSTLATDADHNFFQSLVPDIQTMTMEQKRKLKIGILQLIDGILNTCQQEKPSFRLYAS